MTIRLLTSRSELLPHLDEVRAAADAERAAFGFLPKSAYEEFAFQGRMIIAADADSGDMLGYVLYGGALPQAKVFQTWTAPEARGQRIGRRLIAEVVSRLEAFHYLSVRADVAQELDRANDFYGGLGFELLSTRPGKTRGRKINVRVRELATPSLIEMATARSDSQACLPVVLPATAKVPLYVLDLNVLFDVARRRTQAAYSGKVFGAGFENDVRLAVSAELVSELQRNTNPSAPDPILEFAASLPRLPKPPRTVQEQRINELGPIIFPERNMAGRLKTQDRSDLVHLATAIHECATGFITSEKAILKGAQLLHDRYSLQILSPEAFGMTLDAEAVESIAMRVQARGSGVRAYPLDDGDHEDAQSFLRQRNMTVSETRALLASGTATLPRRRYLVRVNDEVAAVAAWDAPRGTGGERELQIYVDESSPAASLASDYLVRRAVADVGVLPPSVLKLRTRLGQPSVRRAAFAAGFFRAKTGSLRSEVLQKVAINRAVIPETWPRLREAIRTRAGMMLPKNLPFFSSSSQPVEVENENGECITLALADLERLLSPLVLALPGRPAVVFPITQRYAEDLFSGSAQPTFLSGHEAALRSLRGYVGGTYNTVPEGGLAAFYESGTGGGRKAVTAVARVTRKYLMAKESASHLLREKAVLDDEAVKSMGRGGQVVVTEFEDLILLKRPVPLARLRTLGCVDGANYVTSRPLSHEHLVEILKAGEAHA